MPADGQSTVLRPLAEANSEPAAGLWLPSPTSCTGSSGPLTQRDWRNQDKVPQTGGVIFVANHISNADPLALGQFLAFSGRWPRFLAKASIFKVPVLGRMLAACGQIPVERTVGQVGRRAAGRHGRRRGRVGPW